MKKEFIKDLKIYMELFGDCFLRDRKTGIIKRYELIDKDQRHIYETKSKGKLMDGITRYGSGKRTNKKNDSFTMLTCPSDDGIKFMVVVEGEGVVKDSTEDRMISSADFVTKTLKSWFNTLSAGDIRKFDSETINKNVKIELDKISEKLKQAEGDNSTKIIMALVCDDITYVLNVGDLRCYLDNGEHLVQVNEEDSEMWENYRMGYLASKEELRAHVNEEYRVSKVGSNKESEKFVISSYLLSTDSYDRLYLFSRGVIDNISEDRIDIINSNSVDNDVVEKIVDVCANVSCAENTFGDKDITACVYCKVKK